MKKIVMTLVMLLLVATLSISAFAATEAKDSPVLDGGKDPSGGAVESPDTGVGVAAALAGLGVLDTALIGAYLAGKKNEE